ncbi:hypothetical protein FG386_002459 [Cryptosporidium ryanae]|uniref:uncharacterized protein n=1 Tax=Cryptosporidium ryanae TaxID=515981 RepID=UPI00351A00B4|nr:hypothetical protein FG386_002459 [Cryptosporidium ryanae]
MGKLLYLFLLSFFTIYEFSSATNSNPDLLLSENKTLYGGPGDNEFNYTELLPSIEAVAESLINLFSKEELRKLVSLIDPDYGISVCKLCKRSIGEEVEVSPEIFFEMMSKNLSQIPMYELLDVPEMLSNATRLRKIQNAIRSRRPIRPRRQIKRRHPSNVPGASPYVVLEQVIERWIPHSDDQVINRILYDKKDFEDE